MCRAGQTTSSLGSVGSVISTIVCIDFHCTVYSTLNLCPLKAPRAAPCPPSRGLAQPRGGPDRSWALLAGLLWYPALQGWGTKVPARKRGPRKPVKWLQWMVILRGDQGGLGLSQDGEDWKWCFGSVQGSSQELHIRIPPSLSELSSLKTLPLFEDQSMIQGATWLEERRRCQSWLCELRPVTPLL